MLYTPPFQIWCKAMVILLYEFCLSSSYGSLSTFLQFSRNFTFRLSPNSQGQTSFGFFSAIPKPCISHSYRVRWLCLRFSLPSPLHIFQHRIFCASKHFNLSSFQCPFRDSFTCCVFPYMSAIQCFNDVTQMCFSGAVISSIGVFSDFRRKLIRNIM